MFTGLKVIELASVLAGPSVGQFFAELGAEVLKVENPETGGDVTRSWKATGENTDTRSAYFCSANWGKKSVSLNLQQPSDKIALLKLIADCDVVITSYKPGDAEKLGVDYKTLTQINPSLIYGSITGYGQDDSRVGYDAVIQAEAGFMSINGAAGGPSIKMPVALIDVLAAHHLKEGLLVALLHRSLTGKGDYVEVSLIQAAISSLANQATNWLIGGKVPQKQGSAHPNIAPYGDVFITSDGKELLLAVGSDKQFKALWVALDIQDHIAFNQFATNKGRVDNRNALIEMLSKSIALFSAVDLMEKLSKRNIPAGVVQSIDQVFTMSQARELLLQSDDLKGVRHYVAQHRNLSVKSQPMSSPPVLGQNTQEVLSNYQDLY